MLTIVKAMAIFGVRGKISTRQHELQVFEIRYHYDPGQEFCIQAAVTAEPDQEARYLGVCAGQQEDRGWCAYREAVLSLTRKVVSRGYVETLRAFLGSGSDTTRNESAI